MTVSRDGSAGMVIEMPGYEGKPWGYVAGTRLGKRYVSYYLMSVYARPGADGLDVARARARECRASRASTSPRSTSRSSPSSRP